VLCGGLTLGTHLIYTSVVMNYGPEPQPILLVGAFLFSRPESAEGMVGMEIAVRSDKTLKRYYRIINKKYFLNALPDNVCVRFVNEEDKDEEEKCEENYYGWAERGDDRHKYLIVISKVKNPGWTAKLATLTHECCHLNTDLKDDHGPAFEAQRQMIADRGIFRKGALLRGLTIF